MKILSKKTIAALVAGTFIMAGAITPFIVNANSKTTDDNRPAYHQQKLTPEQKAQRMSQVFGVSQADILKYNTTGMSFKDIGRAAFLANASGKDLSEVISHKTASNTWKDVSMEIGVTKEQFKAAAQNMTANRLNVKLGLDRQTTLDLLHQGHKARNIAMAGLLSKDSGKSINDILAMKTKDNKWQDVAKSLGVNDDTFKKDVKQVKHLFHHKHKHEKRG